MKYFAGLAKAENLVKNLDVKGFNEWGKPGIRCTITQYANQRIGDGFCS